MFAGTSLDDLEAGKTISQGKRNRYIGATPKKFLRTLRLQHAIYLRLKDASVNLTDLTYISGYYDQSHMINDFQKLTGMTPTQYFSDCEAYSDYFQHL